MGLFYCLLPSRKVYLVRFNILILKFCYSVMQCSTQKIFTAACWYKLLLLTIKSLGFISVKAGNVPKLFTEPLISNHYACLRHFFSQEGATQVEQTQKLRKDALS